MKPSPKATARKTLAEVFRENLYRIRLRRDLTQGNVAARAGLSVSYVSMLESGGREPPLGTLEKLADALAVAPEVLIRRKA